MEVRVLGPLQVVDDDRAIELGLKERVLLARLVAARRRVVTDDALVEVLWGDRAPPTARKTLQGHVHRLRRVLGSEGIIRLGEGYGLGPSVDVDLDRFDAALAEGRKAAATGHLDEAAAHYEAARALFRGEPLPELEDDAASAGLRRQVAELERTAEEERLVNELARGRHDDAVGELELLVAADPTRERAWCLLVTALARSGRQGDALDGVARAKRALALELGIEPGPHLRQLEEDVLAQRNPAAAGAGTAAAGPGGATATAGGAVLGRLPVWDTRFYGRADDVAWLIARVPRTRVLVLTGPGGIGKTRLAASVAREVQGAFADGICFVGLAGIVEDATDYAIAEAVGVRREPRRSPLDSLCAWLGERQVLLALDNCEEVVGSVRRAVEILLDRCPGVRILVTSRVPLGVRGELRVPVQPLQRPAAIELLVDRLTALTARLDTDRDGSSVEELCRRLDGVPLALELAAAQCRTLTPAELTVRLARRPDILSDRAGLFEDRHRDLDRLIAWSWEQLSPLAQRVVARLTTIIGAFTLDAAEAIAAGGTVDEADVVRALAEAEDAGLIVQERVGGDIRHRVLEPIRQHAASTMDEPERTAAADRHARWFADLAGAVKIGGSGPDFRHWADLVERELANFRQAHRLLIERSDAAGAVAIVDGLAIVGWERALMELADWCDATVALVSGRGDALELAAAAAAAQFWWLQNRVDEISAVAARVASIDGDLDHHLAIVRSEVFGTLDPHRWEQARLRLRRELARRAPGETTWWLAQATAQLQLLDGLDESDVWPIAERLGSPVFSARVAFFWGVPHYLRDEDATAAAFAEEAVGLARAAGATYELADALLGHGGWRARLADATDAEVFEPLLESLDLWERLRVPWGRVAVMEEIAQALAIRGRPEEAFALWGAVDATPIQAPAKVGRDRRAGPYLSGVPGEQADAWRARGAAMSLDRAVAFARGVVVDLIG